MSVALTAKRHDQMTLTIFRDLLSRWARYVANQNRSRLGYAQSSYTEMIGATFSDQTPDVDLQVLAWDNLFRTSLPPNLREILWEAHLMPGKAKDKAKNRTRYFEAKRAAEETAMYLFMMRSTD